MKAEPTPWRTLLAIALTLGVAPTQFWRLSLREWRALMAPVCPGLSRPELSALAERFPDINNG